ncbi:MAG: hypothetical protein IT497_05625 [Ottowia sp.]|nr:hypothetical protein [Ottowia sp.]
MNKITLLCALLSLGGCASQFATQKATQDNAQSVAQQMIARHAKDLPKIASAKVRAVERSSDTGDTSVHAVNLPLSSVLEGLAKNRYAVSYGEEVESNRSVTIALQELSREAAIRKVALAAGYVATIDRSSNMVVLGKKATYTFALPPSLINNIVTSYTVGGNPVSSSGGGGSGGGSGDAGSSGIQANFTMSNSARNNPNTFTSLISSLAGQGAQVSLSQDLGFLVVSGNGQQLDRVRSFINKAAFDAQRSVEIETSIIDVELNDEFQFGVDWSRVFKGTTFSFKGAAAVATPAGSVLYTGESIKSTLNLLREYANFKVISSPRGSAMNRTPAVFFDGVKRPFVGSLTNTPVAVAGSSTTTTSTTAAYSYVDDGISLSFKAVILDGKRVQFEIVPVIARVKGFDKTTIGDNTIKAPIQPIISSAMVGQVESGQTIIMGGISYSSERSQKTGLPMMQWVLPTEVAEAGAHREVIILLRAKVITPQPMDTLFSESL